MTIWSSLGVHQEASVVKHPSLVRCTFKTTRIQWYSATFGFRNSISFGFFRIGNEQTHVFSIAPKLSYLLLHSGKSLILPRASLGKQCGVYVCETPNDSSQVLHSSVDSLPSALLGYSGRIHSPPHRRILPVNQFPESRALKDSNRRNPRYRQPPPHSQHPQSCHR